MSGLAKSYVESSTAHRPIRLRLRTAIYIALSFVFLLTTYFALSFISIRHSLSDRSDREVFDQMDSILSEVSQRGDLAQFPAIVSRHNSTGEASIAFRLVMNGPAQTLGPRQLIGVFDSVRIDASTLPSDLVYHGSTLRVFVRTLNEKTLYAAINTIAFHEVFESMLNTYIILLVTGILVSFLLAYFTADLALSPIKRLVTSALTIREQASSEAILPTDTKTSEVNELARVINEILRERDRNFDALKHFTADAAHELRTPLSILKGEMEVDLRTKPLASADRESIESNLEEVNRLIVIVEDLLALARVEQTVRQDEHIGVLRLGEVMDDIIVRYAPLAAKRSVTFKRNYTIDPELRIERDKLERILNNIILNAIEYSPEHGTIDLAIESGGNGEIAFSVTDHGIGIAEHELPHIFERFWRADRSRSRKSGGSGLGLAIAKGYAEKLGIELSCKSSINVGTTMVGSLKTTPFF